MSVFVIKIIACVTMLLDHVKYAIPETRNFVTLYFGRIAFPLFAFLLTEGYVHTSDLKKYYKRLILFAIISQVPFSLFRSIVGNGDWKILNIMFTMLLGLTAITIYDKSKNRLVAVLGVLIMIYLGEFLNVDYGWFGVALIFIFYLFKDKKIILSVSYICLILVYLAINHFFLLNTVIYYFIGYCIPLIIILFYNGKLGRKIKYFYYVFYPVHMIVLYIISLLVY